MNADPYAYPGSCVLRNQLGLTDARALEAAERALVTQRASEGLPTGHFDLAHLCAIHRHLFQDVHEWAGEVRSVEIAKEQQQFQFRRFLETGMADIHRRLAARDHVRDLSRSAFAAAAGEIMGDVNYVHPFREGNGRTQLFYLEQLAAHAGHPIELSRIDPRRWLDASSAAHGGEYRLMADEIERALLPGPIEG